MANQNAVTLTQVVTGVQQALDPLNSALQVVETKVTNLENNPGTGTGGQAVTELQSKVQTLETTSETEKTKVTTLQGDVTTAKTDIDSLKTKVQNLEDASSEFTDAEAQAWLNEALGTTGVVYEIED